MSESQKDLVLNDEVPTELELRLTARKKEFTLNKLDCNLRKLKVYGNKKIINNLDSLPSKLNKLELYLVKLYKPIDYLPVTLYSLIITSPDFDQPIDNLPSCLEVLYISSHNFSKSIKNLPDSLIMLGLFSNEYIGDFNVPKNLKYLVCNCISGKEEISTFPESLEFLHLQISDYDSITYDFESKLPTKLKELLISSNMTINYNKLPKNLKNLVYVENLDLHSKYWRYRQDLFEDYDLPSIYHKTGSFKINGFDFKIIVYKNMLYTGDEKNIWSTDFEYIIDTDKDLHTFYDSDEDA